MRSRAISQGLAASLLLLVLPAGAQPVLDRTGTREPAKKAEFLFATRVTRAAGLPLDQVSRLRQPAGKPRPLAGRVFRGAGVRVDLTGLAVRRLRFESAKHAAAAAALLGRGARVDSKQPRCVTQVLGPKAGPQVVAQVEGVATGPTLPADLGKTLGAKETARGVDACELRVPRAAIGFRGVEVRLKGLAVFRLRFATEAAAAAFVEGRAARLTSRHVLDQVGSEVVLLMGPALAKASAARKALPAAWKAGGSAAGKRGVIGVWTRQGAFAVFCASNGALYQRGADLLRRCRAAASGVTRAGIEWRFTDLEPRNDLRLRPKLVRPGAAARYGGVLATSGGLLHVSSSKSLAPERRALLTLLEAVGMPLAKRTERVRLLAPE